MYMHVQYYIMYMYIYIVHVHGIHIRVLSGGGGETRVCFPPKIIWPNNGNYTGIALFLITLQVHVLESLVVLLKYMMRVLKAKADL